jgi:hypothetical protein
VVENARPTSPAERPFAESRSGIRRLTGLELSELLSRQNTQLLTQIDESGAREECVRVPVELLLEEPAD